MKKFKFNFKLTLFLVGLFISFLLIFLSGKFEVCRPIGLICLGVSFILYIYFYSDNVSKTLKRIQREITKLEDGEDESFQEDYEEDDLNENEQELMEDLTQEEKEYMLMQLYLKKKKITKSNKKIKFLFILSGGLLIVAGFLLFI